MIRQGDILLIPCNIVDRKVIRNKGGVIATGEATGHAHRCDDNGEVITVVVNGREFDVVRVSGSCVVSHDEHSAVTLTEGDYEVRRQRELGADDIIRTVSD